MAESFDHFNAPQFFDFIRNTTEHEHADNYFDMDHETSKDPLTNSLPLEDVTITAEADEKFSLEYQPTEDPLDSHVYYEAFTRETECEERAHFRRSMSASDIFCLKEAYKLSEGVEKLKQKEHKIDEGERQVVKKHGSFASLNERDLHSDRLKPATQRSISRESVNRLAQPKQHFTSEENLNKNRYVPMAEALRKFQKSTPERFRTKPKKESFNSGNVPCKLTHTIPQSPNLKTTTRSRPVDVLSREEQEKLEFEEAQRFKIKANPVNKKILQGPMKPTVPVEKKPATVPEPFKLTAPIKKVADSPKRTAVEFHARPVPKYINEPPKLKATLKTHITQPQTPSFMRRHHHNEPSKPQAEVKPQPSAAGKLRNTKPLPFSFEIRDLHMKHKREEMLQRVLEEEKKAREFHARPVPKSLSQPMKNRSLTRSGSQRSLQSLGKSDENLTKQFKARPATILTKKPFEPKKLEKPLVEISEFTLNTDLRARERELFEQRKKEKEEKLQYYKEMEEMRRMQEEAEERARLRKEAETKAQPIRKYKEVKIQPSDKVTTPISPVLHTERFRKMRLADDKENSQTK